MPNMGENNGEQQEGNNTETPQRVRQEMEIREKMILKILYGRTGKFFEQKLS